MNEINKYVITVTFDAWMPFDKELQREIDDLLGKLRSRELLGHAGNVKTLLKKEHEETNESKGRD